MPSCVAYGCNNSRKKKVEGVSFHRFPQNEEIRKKWILAVKRENWEPSNWSTLCSSHFKEEDFDRTLQRVQLKVHAVPSIFPAIAPPPTKRLSSNYKRKAGDDSTSMCSHDSPKKQELRKKLKIAEGKVHTYKRKVKTLLQANRRLSKKVVSLEEIVKSLREKLHMQEESLSLLNSISKTSDCLINRMHLKVTNPNLKKVYDERLKAFAITLHFLSPRAYIFVRKMFDTALPHPRTLRNWYATIKGSPGFSQEVFTALKAYSANSKCPAVCSLMMDCMSIKKQLVWDGKMYHGTVNIGFSTGDDSSALASEALVFYLVFINSSWKVPLGYFFVNGTTGEQQCELTKHCISLLHDAGIRVASLTCDGNACNLSMATNLGCSFDISNMVTTFPHPITKAPVHFFLDPAHMLKLVRNTLGDYKILLNSNNELIEWRYIEMLHEIQKNEGLHLGNRLTNEHINYFKQKMKVRLAAQVLSDSVSDALQFLKSNEIEGFEKCGPTIEFLRILNSTFDILNSKSMKESYNKKALHPGNIKQQTETLIKAKEYLTTLKEKLGTPILKSKRRTGFLGFIVCISSALSLYDQFVGDGSHIYPLKYLPLYKISQDHIERLFGYIRSRNGYNNNPTCKEFAVSFKKILLHAELSESSSGNTLVLDKTVLFNVSRYKSPEDDINATLPGWCVLQEGHEQQPEPSDVFFHPSDQLSANIDQITFNIVEYISGFVARSISSKLNCEHCLLTLTEGNINSDSSLISCKNRGGLMQPSQGVIFICKTCESVIRPYLVNNSIIKKRNAINTMFLKVLNQCIGRDIFKNESTHFSMQDPDQNHFILLIKAICNKYFTIRLHHFSKLHNQTLHKQRIRNHLTKTITFLGQ